LVYQWVVPSLSHIVVVTTYVDIEGIIGIHYVSQVYKYVGKILSLGIKYENSFVLVLIDDIDGVDSGVGKIQVRG